MPSQINKTIVTGAVTQNIKTINPPTMVTKRQKSPITIMIVRRMNPIIREISPIIIKLAKSSKLQLFPRSSVMRFHGETHERISCGIEKK